MPDESIILKQTALQKKTITAAASTTKKFQFINNFK